MLVVDPTSATHTSMGNGCAAPLACWRPRPNPAFRPQSARLCPLDVRNPDGPQASRHRVAQVGADGVRGVPAGGAAGSTTAGPAAAAGAVRKRRA